jgi:hypothetical protein
MDRCALEFIARRWWRRTEVWAIAVVLVVLSWVTRSPTGPSRKARAIKLRAFARPMTPQ